MFHQVNPKTMARRLVQLSAGSLTHAQALEEAAQLLGFSSYRAYKAVIAESAKVLYSTVLDNPDAESNYQLTVVPAEQGLNLVVKPNQGAELAGRPAVYLQISVKDGLPCVEVANQPSTGFLSIYGHGQGLITQSPDLAHSLKTGVPSQSELAEAVRDLGFRGQPITFVEVPNGTRPVIETISVADERPIPVVTAPGIEGVWSILENLTSRDGELNGYRKAHTAAFRLLEANPNLLARCHQLMWDEITFVAQKDGELGLLFEVEYLSQESEEGTDPDAHTYEPQALLVARLAARVAELSLRYPGIAFAVNPGHNTVNCRAVMWAFVPVSHGTPMLSRRIGEDMLDIAYGS